MATMDIFPKVGEVDWASDQHLVDVLHNVPPKPLMSRIREWSDQMLGTNLEQRHRLELAAGALGILALAAGEELGRRKLGHR